MAAFALDRAGHCVGYPHEERAIGDLLLAEPLVDASYTKISDKHGMQPRGDMWPPPDSLRQIVKSCHRDWQKKSPDERRRLHPGKVLSLPTLLDKMSLRNELLTDYPGTIGGEMEGRGLVDAAVEHKCDWLVLKAICDWGAEKNINDAQKEIDQALAAKQAATFLRFAIEEGVGTLAASWQSRRARVAGPSGGKVIMNISNVSGTVIGSAGTVNINHGLRPGDVVDGGNF